MRSFIPETPTTLMAIALALSLWIGPAPDAVQAQGSLQDRVDQLEQQQWSDRMRQEWQRDEDRRRQEWQRDDNRREAEQERARDRSFEVPYMLPHDDPHGQWLRCELMKRYENVIGPCPEKPTR